MAATKGLLFVYSADDVAAAAREFAAIAAALSAVGVPTPDQAVVATEADVFDAIVRYRPAVLHVAAHGGSSLPFRRNIGTGRRLVDLVLPPRLAVLHRCFSRPVALDLAQVFGRVIGLVGLPDPSYRQLAAFYDGLARSSDPRVAVRGYGDVHAEVVAERPRLFHFGPPMTIGESSPRPIELMTRCESVLDLAVQDDIEFGQGGFFARSLSLPRDAHVEFQVKLRDGTAAVAGRGTVTMTEGGSGIRIDRLEQSSLVVLDEILMAKVHLPIDLGRQRTARFEFLDEEALNVDAFDDIELAERRLLFDGSVPPIDLAAHYRNVPAPPLEEEFQQGALFLNAWFLAVPPAAAGRPVAYELLVSLGKLVDQAIGAPVPRKTAHTLRMAADDISIFVACRDADITPRSRRLILHGAPVAFEVRPRPHAPEELQVDLILCVRGEPIFETRVAHRIAAAAAELHP